MAVKTETTYLGLELKNPLVAAASPMTKSLEGIKQLEEAGFAAVVLPSLFEEQIEHEASQVQGLYEYQSDSFAESLSYFPELDSLRVGPSKHLELIEEAKTAVSIPVIASLNGSTQGGWISYAERMRDAGADALELNIYFVPTDCQTSAADVEKRYVELVAMVKEAVGIPLAVKVGSQFSSIPNMALQLVEAGADGLVMFNRFLEPDVDLETLRLTPDLVLSKPHELRLPLRWIAILRDQLDCSLAATSGVHTAEDVARALLVGTDVVQLATVLLEKGPGYGATMLEGLIEWMTEAEYESVAQLRGSLSRAHCPDPSALERANYLKALVSYTAEA